MVCGEGREVLKLGEEEEKRRTFFRPPDCPSGCSIFFSCIMIGWCLAENKIRKNTRTEFLGVRGRADIGGGGGKVESNCAPLILEQQVSPFPPNPPSCSSILTTEFPPALQRLSSNTARIYIATHLPASAPNHTPRCPIPTATMVTTSHGPTATPPRNGWRSTFGTTLIGPLAGTINRRQP